MKLTPLDIYQKEFRRKKLNGLDPEDVEQFLFQVAEGLEALLHENAHLAQRLERGGAQPAEQGAGVGSEAAGATGRQVAQREVETARQEAQRIADEARAKAKSIVDDARAQAQRIGEAGQARAPRPAAATNERVKQFAREYQSMLVTHLSHVTHHLGSEEEDDPSSVTASSAGASSGTLADTLEGSLADTATDASELVAETASEVAPSEDRTTELGTRPQ